MPQRVIDEQIKSLRERQRELLAQSDELEKQLAALRSNREAPGVVDDTRILAKPDAQEAQTAARHLQ